MLGFSGAEPSFPRPRARTRGEGTAPPKASALSLVHSTNGAEQALADGERLAEARLSQRERRVVGQFLHLAGVALDFAVIATVPYLAGMSIHSNKRVVLIYALVATVLLLPTHRRLRLVPRPSEQVTAVGMRIVLAPVFTSILLYRGDLRFKEFVLLLAWTVPAVLAGRLLMFKVVHRARVRGYDQEDTLIVGAGPVGVEVARALDANPDFGLRPAGFVDRFDEFLTLPIVGSPEDLATVLEETGVRDVVIAFGSAGEREIVEYVRDCAHLNVQFYAVPRFFELGAQMRHVGYEVDGFALMPLRRLNGHMWFAKRAFDVAASMLLLLLTAPVFGVCAAAVKLSSPGPVFFRQVRIGRGGRPFEILKFRSMRVNDDSATQWSVDDDDRVTKVGAFMRKTHLDELPQLVNVLRGDMAIVGPRPERPYFVEQFSSEIDSYGHRHRMPVGITGWAQVNGYWGDSSIETRVRLDNRYIENWTLWRDVVIGLRTIPTLLGKRRDH